MQPSLLLGNGHGGMSTNPWSASKQKRGDKVFFLEKPTEAEGDAIAEELVYEIAQLFLKRRGVLGVGNGGR